MAAKKTAEKLLDFPAFLLEETERVREDYYPVKAGLFTRLMKKWEKPGKLHPNPDDEFSMKEIGPNYGIVAEYEEAYRRYMGISSQYENSGSPMEPLIVQKARPDGYLILNGHHRWAAAMRMNIRKVRIQIVNLTQVKDVRDMLARSRSDSRAVVDLDETVFAAEGDTALEKPLPFPLNRFFRERVRRGIPALFHTLSDREYDIWVYSAGYYSMDYIRHYFKAWNVRLAGILTGTGRKIARDAKTDREMKKLIDTKYTCTLHIDKDLVLQTFSGSRACDEYPLSGSPDSWVREVADAIEKMAKKGEKARRMSSGQG